MYTFLLVLVYSLLPGIYKILGMQLFLLFSVPIIFLLLKKDRQNLKLHRFDSVFILYLCYILLQSIIWPLIPATNTLGIIIGMFMNVIPMAGYVWSKYYDVEKISEIILPVIAIHCVIGILLYPIFGIVSYTNPIVQALTDGVAFARMASVSGSLGFGNLTMIGFILITLPVKATIV